MEKDNAKTTDDDVTTPFRSSMITKCLLAGVLLCCAFVGRRQQQQQDGRDLSLPTTTGGGSELFPNHRHRRLTMIGDTVPQYMEPLMKDLHERQKLFDETPPEEVKYWFEYTGPLQVSVQNIESDFV